MANFATHIGFGTVAAGTLATATIATGLVQPDDLIAVTLAGVLGSILPDIDLDESRPSRMVFSGLAVFFSFAALFTFAAQFSVIEMLIVWLGTLVLVRYGLYELFNRFSVHRGIWHSLLAAAFCSAATAVVFARILGRPEGIAWLAGAFMFVGYLTHLVLDEVYSVDVMDRHLKASFGTALKLADWRHPLHTAAMAAALAFTLYAAPPATTFYAHVASRNLWTTLEGRLLPQGKWFGLIGTGTGRKHAASQSGGA